MKSRTTPEFRALYAELPEEIRKKTRQAYKRWLAQHDHPSLHFKPIPNNPGFYSVRITLGWRALGRFDGETIYWHWVGPHDVYERMINRR